MCTIDNLDFASLQIEHVINAYYSQDLEAITEAMNEQMEGGNCGMAEREEESMDRLVYSRNRNWLTLMPTIMKDKSTLFAVGAGHLGGERGVLALLRQAGFTVQGVR